MCDWIRHTYLCEMRFYRNDPQRLTRVQWYFCEPTAKLLPFPTAFHSRIFLSPPYASWTLGQDLSRPVVFRPKRNAAGHIGLCHIGTAEQYAFGLTGTETPVPVPDCCRVEQARAVAGCAASDGGPNWWRTISALAVAGGEAAAAAAAGLEPDGGLALGGEADFEFTPGGGPVATVCCPDGLPSVLTLTFTSCVGLYAAYYSTLSVPLTWDGGLNAWTGSYDRQDPLVPGTELLQFECNGIISESCSGMLLIQLSQGVTSDPLSCTCSPPFFSYPGLYTGDFTFATFEVS